MNPLGMQTFSRGTQKRQFWVFWDFGKNGEKRVKNMSKNGVFFMFFVKNMLRGEESEGKYST